MRHSAFLASASVLVLAIISTTFVFLTLTSKRWAVQNYYFNDSPGSTGDGSTDIDPVTWAYRSPFYKCGIPMINASAAVVPDCRFYKPHGTATSCRTTGEMKQPWDHAAIAQGLLGTAQECQQVHFAGNLQIASCAFLALALFLSLVICLATLIPHRRGPSEEQTHATREHKDGTTVARHRHTQPHSSRARPIIGVFLIAFLYVGAALQILAQFFGVLGLTVTASPNSRDAYTDQPKPSFNNFDAAEWTIDLALSRYATVAWTSAVLAAVLATVLFQAPVFRKVV